MAAFLLWNVDKRPLDGLVQNLIRQLRIDIVLLIEYAHVESQLGRLLLGEGFTRQKSPDQFGVFVRDDQALKTLRNPVGKRACLWRWTAPSGLDGLLVLLHAPDRRNHDDGTRRVFFRRVADAVRKVEKTRGNRRTIIAGDFNAQPFEPAMTDSDGLHAIGLRTLSSGATRMIQGVGKSPDFFYNPMWGAYGHREHPEAGAATYYLMKRRAHEPGWYMLDQVVLRPEEAPRFPEDRLQIITQIGDVSLLDPAGRPDGRVASDHLPLVFHWDL